MERGTSRTAEEHFLTWKPEYSVHIDAIDRQHQALVAFIRQLQEAMEEGRGRAYQSTLVENLMAYTQGHFRFEEDLMRENGYAGLGEHVRQHEALTSQVRELREKVRSGSVVSNASVMMFLRHWLTDHIMEHDQAYARSIGRLSI
jgi:hemerythrin-like metal-binding protein